MLFRSDGGGVWTANSRLIDREGVHVGTNQDRPTARKRGRSAAAQDGHDAGLCDAFTDAKSGLAGEMRDAAGGAYLLPRKFRVHVKVTPEFQDETIIVGRAGEMAIHQASVDPVTGRDTHSGAGTVTDTTPGAARASSGAKPAFVPST